MQFGILNFNANIDDFATIDDALDCVVFYAQLLKQGVQGELNLRCTMNNGANHSVDVGVDYSKRRFYLTGQIGVGCNNTSEFINALIAIFINKKQDAAYYGVEYDLDIEQISFEIYN